MYKRSGTCEQLLGSLDEIRDRIRGFGLSSWEASIQELLAEEVLNYLCRHAGSGREITVTLRKWFGHLNASYRFAGEPVDLNRNNAHEGMEDSIRGRLLREYNRCIDCRRKDDINTITIRVTPDRSEAAAEKIDAYYQAHKDNPPTAMEQLRWGFSLYPKEFALSVLIKIGRSLPVVVLPIITANVIDIVSQKGSAAALWTNLIVALVLLLSNVLFAYLIAAVLEKACRDMEEAFRDAMIRRLQMLSVSYHNETQNGLITSKLMRDVENFPMVYRWLFNDGINIIVYVVAAVIMTLINCPWMSLFFLLCIPMALGLSAMFRGSVSTRNKDYRVRMEEGSSAVDEMLGMIEVTRAHGLQKSENRRVARYMTRIQKTGTELDIVNEVLGAVSWFILQFFQLLCLAVSAFLASKGMITLGMIALFQSYFSTIVTRASTMINAYPQIAKGMESFNSIAEILCADSAEHTGSQVISKRLEGHIQLEDVTFRFKNNDKDLFSHFSLDIPAQSSIALVGPSGCGKSTLVNMIIGFLTPDQGKVLIDGYDLFDLDLARYRSSIAVVPQHSTLFRETLYNNLTYGIPYVSEEDVREALSSVGLEDYVNKLPEGLETEIEEGGGNLSGGQRQRLSVARALLRKPRILILDEPTSALDRESEEKIVRLIDDLKGRCTVIIIAHRLNTIRNVDQVIVLEEGRIKAQGRFDEVKDELHES